MDIIRFIVTWLLPEVIQINKIFVSDEPTDLRVTMTRDALENEGKLESEGWNLFLRRVFRSRLADFLTSHSEVHQSVCSMLIL